jgi:hypothetical protein
MSNVIEVRDENRVTVGSITFDKAPRNLSAYRSAGEFQVSFPMTVSLELANRLDPCPMLSSIYAVVVAKKDTGNAAMIGRARQEAWFTGLVKKSSTESALVWSDTLAALVAYERFRDAKPPTFSLSVNAELCYLLPPAISGRRTRTEPFPIHGQVELTYPNEIWVRMLRDLRVSHPVLVEVPLPSSPPGPWDEVWRAVGEATTAFERGGETGWKGCGGAVRLALEQWRKIEEEDMGPGWQHPKREDLELRTSRQRIDNIRWHLRQYANLAPHTGAEQWSRDDALLMLSTLSSLLVLRRP